MKIADKVTLVRRRAELVESLAAPLPPEERVRVQGELSVVNAQIKALNTTEAARLKAEADRRKAAGLAEAKANAARAGVKRTWPSSAPGEPGFGDPINKRSIRDDEETAAIDAWIVAVLQRGGVEVHRASDGNLDVLDAPAKWVGIVDALCAGLHAAARGEELPEVTAAPKAKARRRS